VPKLILRVQNVSDAASMFVLEGLERKEDTEGAAGEVQIMASRDDFHALVTIRSDAAIFPGEQMHQEAVLDLDFGALTWHVPNELQGRWKFLEPSGDGAPLRLSIGSGIGV
jgi:hypothetical protein